jgi:2-amino-4-hydroxy-6-hydroxymethyldihydropteridine diphosphokinase
MINIAYIGLGSNLGDRAANLRRAAMALRALLGPLRASRVYETAPRLDLDQPPFLNAVVEARASFPPEALLNLLLGVEATLGRQRDLARPKGPRVIDLDLLLYGDHLQQSDRLTLPHPGLAHRRFVLAPLRELAPALAPPGLGATIDALWARCDDDGDLRLCDAPLLDHTEVTP